MVFAAVRQWRKEIDSRIVDDVHQLLLVGEKLFNRAVPAGEIGRCADWSGQRSSGNVGQV